MPAAGLGVAGFLIFRRTPGSTSVHRVFYCNSTA